MNEKYLKYLVKKTINIIDAISRLDEGGIGAIFVVGENQVLEGIVTDGDVRRAIIRGIDLSESVSVIMNANYKYLRDNQDRKEGIAYLKKIQRRHLPIIDSKKVLIDILILDDLNFKRYDNIVCIMAGGLGDRLRPLTEQCPKPLLKIGNKPILETILEGLIDCGFWNFYFCVNYKAQMIEDYFGDGERWGIEIKYIHEPTKLGTAGALSLLPENTKEPILVMNGDLLTKLNFEQLLQFHIENNAKATMCVRDYSFRVPYGVVNIENEKLISIEEKPLHNFFVSAGVYVLDPDVLSLIPNNTFYEMPFLFETLIERTLKTIVFHVREYWLDIGRIDDFERANGEYGQVFG